MGCIRWVFINAIYTMTLGILPYMLRESTIVYYINTIYTNLAPVYIYEYQYYVYTMVAVYRQ